MGYSTRDIRNIALVGHGDAGKTTLADTILARVGAGAKKGESLFDFEPDEKARGCSIDTASAHFHHEGHEFNLIDVPGGPDFIGEVVSAIQAADMVFVCVSAHSGIMVNTRRCWDAARLPRCPVGFIITKCDGESEERIFDVFSSLREAFGSRCIPINGPSSLGDFSSVWKEGAVEVDDELMTAYLEGKELPEELLDQAARRAVAARKLFPVLFVSAQNGDGLPELLHFMAIDVPGPNRAVRVYRDEQGGRGDPLAPDPDGPFLGEVWKVHVDRHVGRIGHVRILSGSLRHGDSIVNLRTQKRDKVHHLARPHGKDHAPIDHAITGDLVVLTKVDGLHVGDTLAADAAQRPIWHQPHPTPMFALAVTPKNRGDEAKVSDSLAKVADECPTFRVKREPSTGELLVYGTSQLHVEVWLRRIKERFGVELETHTPRVPYRETISGQASARYRHKKQSGGRGQFAEVALSITPAEPGSGLIYSWDVFGGAIPTNYKEAIHKGVIEVMQRGCVAGYALEDVKVSVTDGKHHEVDSSDQAFKLAAGRAFSEAVRNARPILLEPTVKLDISIPAEFMGDVSSDLNSRRGRIHGMDQEGPYQILRAEMPLSEAMDYSRTLTSITSGQGAFTMEAGAYEPVPSQLQAELVGRYKPHPDEE